MDKSREMVATIVGAIIGAVAGYMFFTERGRSVRLQIEPALEDFSRELLGFRNTIQKAAGLANEGWKLLHDTLGKDGYLPGRHPSGQTSPFAGHTYVR
jgi:gas vesicle protein